MTFDRIKAEEKIDEFSMPMDEQFEWLEEEACALGIELSVSPEQGTDLFCTKINPSPFNPTWYETVDHRGNIRSVTPKPIAHKNNHHIFDANGNYNGRR